MRILVTAGPTKEYLDPVRYLSNSSTGFFGYKIAEEAIKRGHKVVLVSGPTSLKPPKGAKFVPVISAIEMKKAVEKFFPESDCLVMSAAVADYRPIKIAVQKIKKDKNRITVKLIRNPDILSEAAKKKGNKMVIGFALESKDLYDSAKEKLINKNLDCIIAASINDKENPFGNEKIQVLIIERDKKPRIIFSSKKRISEIILDKIKTMK